MPWDSRYGALLITSYHLITTDSASGISVAKASDEASHVIIRSKHPALPLALHDYFYFEVKVNHDSGSRYVSPTLNLRIVFLELTFPDQEPRHRLL